jgi:hypothetical protein
MMGRSFSARVLGTGVRLGGYRGVGAGWLRSSGGRGEGAGRGGEQQGREAGERGVRGQMGGW